MADDILSLSSAFPEAEEAQWLALVDKALKGGSPDKLNSQTMDGLTIKALYRSPDAPTSDDPDGYPGLAPYLRGARATPDPFLPWDIRQIISHADPVVANKDLLKDLENGVSSIELRIDESGGRGVCVRNQDDIMRAIDGVMLDLAPISLDVTGESSGADIPVAAILASALAKRGDDVSKLRVSFNVDPIGSLVRKGYLVETFDDSLQSAVSFAKDAAQEFTNASFIRVDARPAHEAGGSEAQELALLFSSAVAYLRAGLKAGLSASKVADALVFTMSCSADYLKEVAKLRAARRIWSDITAAFGVKDAPMKLHAISSRRMLSARDPWTNILRNTAACFAAGVGGADIVTIRPFTDALGLPASLGRRIARNTQIIAQEEVFLGKVADPVGGAWAVADLSDKMAQAGWEAFQAIEAEGGVAKAFELGRFQGDVAHIRHMRLSRVAKRKTMITGVSDFPTLETNPAPVERIDLDEILASAKPNTGEKPRSNAWRDLVEAGSKGATIGDIKLDGDAVEVDPLWPIRLAKPFERLRKHADKFEAKTGEKPKIFLAALGPQSDHTPRLTYARNFFAAGGIESVVENLEPQQLGEAFEKSDCVLACICGSDERYASLVPDTARALGAAGVARLYLAGRPGDSEQLWREAGIDEFIHIGVDAVDCLEIALSELGLTV